MLRDRKNRIRLVLFILAILIAVGSFTTWAIKLGHRESGYQTIVYENTHADVLYRTGISMIYWAEGNAADIRTLSNTVQRIYSDSLYRNFIQLDSAAVYEETENIAALNRRPGEEILIPDRLAGVLRDALERTAADEGYSVYAGALYDEWERLLYLDEPQNADPANSPEEAERISRIAGAVRPENGIRLTLSEGEDGTTACLTVPEEYRRLAEELEISAPVLDLNLLRDAYLMDLVAEDMKAAGYPDYVLFSKSGLALTARAKETLIVSVMKDGEAAATLSAAGPAASIRFAAGELRSDGYGAYTVNGLKRHYWFDARTGGFRDTVDQAVMAGPARAVDLAWEMVRLNCAEDPGTVDIPDDIQCVWTRADNPQEAAPPG